MKLNRRTDSRWFLYILLCEDDSFYVGETSNIERRFIEHKEGRGGRYTLLHKPLKIVYFKDFSNRRLALKRERQIKGWSRKKKINLINKFASRGSSVVRAESS